MDVLRRAVDDGLSGATIEALAICVTPGMAGVKRIELQMSKQKGMEWDDLNSAYTQALILYAESIGIEVHKKENVTFNGWYYLHDAMWQRAMNGA